MAFDAQPDAEVTARDRMIRLRDRIDALPDERFNMRYIFSRDGQALFYAESDDCGTAACILGWAIHAFPHVQPQALHFGRALGLDAAAANALYCPTGYRERPADFTRARAVAVLDHYLATGEIDWPRAISKLSA